MANDEKNMEAQSTGIDVGKPAAPTVDWDDSNMRSSYANVVNASSTREEVTLFFGTNQTWNPTSERKFRVSLTDRMVLNPYAAKRLWVLLGAILGEYEKRFGPLKIEGIDAAASSVAGRKPNGQQAKKSAAQSASESE